MKLMRLLKDKRFRYGTLSTVMMIVAVVIFILVTLVAEEFNETWDLTAEQRFSLTSQSHRFLENLDMDVTLYYAVRTGGEDLQVSRLLAEYAAASPHITVQQRDPMINPTFLHQFTGGVDGGGIPDGSVIVRSEQGFRVITPLDMDTRFFHPQAWQWVVESIDTERVITQAIHALTLGEPPVVYYVTGSGELELSQAFVDFLTAENFIVREHNAMLHDIPQTADALIITMPDRDWGTAKADRILDYLNNNEGRVFMALNITAEYFPELSRVLRAYGLQLGDYIVIEGDARRTIGNPVWLIPHLARHEQITEPLFNEDFNQLLLASTGLEVLEMRRTSTVIEPLLVSTRDAYGRHLDTEAETILRVPEDAEGPFFMAVAVTDTIFLHTTLTTRMVVVSSLTIMDDVVNSTIGGGNWAFIANSLNWLRDQPPGIWVPVIRPPGSAPVVLTDAQTFTISGIAMGAIPVTLFGIGIFVWLRRRHS